MSDGREVCFLFLPDGEDPDTYVRSNGKEAFFHTVEQAMPLETLLFQTASEGINLDSGAGKAKLSQRALPLIQQLPHGVFKQLMLTKLANETGADISLLQSREAEITASKSPSSGKAAAPKAGANQRNNDRSNPQQTDSNNANDATANKPKKIASSELGLEKTPIVWAIALLLHYPQLAKTTEIPSCVEAIDSKEAKLLLKLFTHIKEQTQAVTTSMLLGYWHGTSEAAALNHCASRHKPSEQEAVATDEFTDVLKRIEEQFEGRELSQFIAELERKPLSDLSEDERKKLKSIGLNKSK
jgi:DNA primase